MKKLIILVLLSSYNCVFSSQELVFRPTSPSDELSFSSSSPAHGTRPISPGEITQLLNEESSSQDSLTSSEELCHKNGHNQPNQILTRQEQYNQLKECAQNLLFYITQEDDPIRRGYSLDQILNEYYSNASVRSVEDIISNEGLDKVKERDKQLSTLIQYFCIMEQHRCNKRKKEYKDLIKENPYLRDIALKSIICLTHTNIHYSQEDKKVKDLKIIKRMWSFYYKKYQKRFRPKELERMFEWLYSIPTNEKDLDLLKLNDTYDKPMRKIRTNFINNLFQPIELEINIKNLLRDLKRKSKLNLQTDQLNDLDEFARALSFGASSPDLSENTTTSSTYLEENCINFCKKCTLCQLKDNLQELRNTNNFDRNDVSNFEEQLNNALHDPNLREISRQHNCYLRRSLFARVNNKINKECASDSLKLLNHYTKKLNSSEKNIFYQFLFTDKNVGVLNAIFDTLTSPSKKLNFVEDVYGEISMIVKDKDCHCTVCTVKDLINITDHKNFFENLQRIGTNLNNLSVEKHLSKTEETQHVATKIADLSACINFYFNSELYNTSQYNKTIEEAFQVETNIVNIFPQLIREEYPTLVDKIQPRCLISKAIDTCNENLFEIVEQFVNSVDFADLCKQKRQNSTN